MSKHKISSLIIVIIFCLLILSSCNVNSPNISDSLIDDLYSNGYIIHADMGNHGLHEDNHVFYEVTFETALYMMKQGETVLIYFGFGDCPWCQVALPILHESTIETGVNRVLYVNRRSSAIWNESEPMKISDSEQTMIDFLSPHMELMTNDDGITRIFVPEVILWNGSTVLSNHRGTLENHNGVDELTEQERHELKSIYSNMFQAYLEMNN